MRSRHKLAALIGVVIALWGLALAVARPQPVAAAERQWVKDSAGVLTPTTMALIDRLNNVTFAKLPGHPQLAVEVRRALPASEQDIDDYKADRFAEWGVGRKGWDNGLLLVVAVKDRKYGLEVGYGLEAAVPDGSMDDIVTDSVTADLKAARYDDAVRAMVDHLSAVLADHRSAIMTPAGIKAERAAQQRSADLDRLLVEIAVLVVLVIVVWLVVRKATRTRLLVKRLNDPAEQAALPLYWGLPEAERVRFAEQLKAPMRGPLDQALLARKLTAYLYDTLGELVLRSADPLPYPWYVYGAVIKRRDAQAVVAQPDWASFLGLIEPDVAPVYTPYAAYAPGFETWAKGAHARALEQQAVWQAFISHVELKDPLDEATLALTLDAILQYQRDPSQHNATDGLPLWVGANYAGGSSGDSSSFGSGFGGGSSGGGGFSGGW
ncbi:TPM domain-containing protein [Lacticaseibacillus absianus]|uniref:TPM domain-containing protein n=1 Tax=Lacticaseibacillus absianus TaxID=2729623 RepID=UPI0015CE6D8F|nr:TPM domain-containing protein [Lacticaseibacillus absianus]